MEKHIRESNLIEGIDDRKEDRQSMKAWLWLLTQKKLDHSIIGQLQKIITKNQNDLVFNQRGFYRDVSKINVSIGNFAGADFRMVKMFMDNWILDYKKLEPIEAHIRFEKIHPFVDGNGRTGRMIMWWQELHTGKLPTLFYAHERQKKYYALFK